MAIIHHLNGGFLHAPPNPRVQCHCLLLEDEGGIALIDTGIGLEDVRNPVERVGVEAIAMAGFQFDEADTLARQLETLGFAPGDVGHVVLTHADPDHTGGLADFPDATVHMALEEARALAGGGWRYRPIQFGHGVNWKLYDTSTERWFGLEARPVELGLETRVLLVPLFGHTLGHCGVAIEQPDGRWALHVGDAYYLRVELDTDDHPVTAIATARADDDELRRASLAELRRLARHHGDVIDMFGYHDPTEFHPAAASTAASDDGAGRH